MITMTSEEMKIYKKLLFVNRYSYTSDRKRKTLRKQSKKWNSNIEFVCANKRTLIYAEVIEQPSDVGREDIHSNKPYLKHSISGHTATIEMVYVPPFRRRQGEGSKLVRRFLSNLQKNIKIVLLCNVNLDKEGCADFYQSLGFTCTKLNSDISGIDEDNESNAILKLKQGD